MKGKKVQFLVGCDFIRRNEPGGIQSISLYLLSPWVGVRFLEQVTEVNMIENKTKQRKTLYETKFQWGSDNQTNKWRTFFQIFISAPKEVGDSELEEGTVMRADRGKDYQVKDRTSAELGISLVYLKGEDFPRTSTSGKTTLWPQWIKTKLKSLCCHVWTWCKAVVNKSPEIPSLQRN